jgi:valyl-tRNA synthetase
MLGDVGVAVHPKDKRYKSFIKKKVVLPLVKRKIPVRADELVDPKFGTGAVKITPARDFVDFEISLKHKLPLIQVIDNEGKIEGKVPKKYIGLTTTEAREEIVENLKKLGFLEGSEDYEISLPVCYRCHGILEIIPSWQWFLKMGKLAKEAISVVKSGKIKFIPKRFEKIYFDWLKNVKDWCISRQIW